MLSWRDRLMIATFIGLGLIGGCVVIPGISSLWDSFHALATAYQDIGVGWFRPWIIAGVASPFLLYGVVWCALQSPPRFYRIAIAAVATAFTIWAALFIYRSSFIATDQQTHFSLFDDAMISMRYAWNWAHGLGLVWNPGERVEGYTNFLMTLIMAPATGLLDKKSAVVAIQVFGILCMLINGWLTIKVAESLNVNRPPQQRFLVSVLSLGLVFAYYPLSYWTLMGMETGLLTGLLLWAMLSALHYGASFRSSYLWMMSIAMGLAYLTRPDSAIPALWIIPYVWWAYHTSSIKPRTWRKPFFALSLYGLFIVGMSLFRWLYYGEIVPNTYILKMAGMPLGARLANGWGFIYPYLQTHGWLYGMAAFGILCFGYSRQRLFCLGLPFIFLVYSIWVGGDPWPYWRFTAPSLPVLLILAAQVCVYIYDKIRSSFQNERSQTGRLFWRLPIVIVGPFAVLISLAINSTFLPEAWFQQVPYQADSNRLNVNRSLAINYLTKPDATVGVFGAGVIPYFTGRQAVDFFGKSDPRIAHLPPDLSGAVSWAGMFSVPGHNKYDLEYSIMTLQPTYIEAAHSGRQDLTEWARNHYVEVTFRRTSLLLLRESPAVYWDRIALLP